MSYSKKVNKNLSKDKVYTKSQVEELIFSFAKEVNRIERMNVCPDDFIYEWIKNNL